MAGRSSRPATPPPKPTATPKRRSRRADPPPPPKRRTSALDNETIRSELLKLLSVGAFRKEAAEAVGVPYVTLKLWLAKGEESLTLCRMYENTDPTDWVGPEPVPAEPWHSFAAEVEVIEAKAQAMLLGLMHRMAQAKDGKDAFRATRWMLETRWPKQYGRRLAIEHSADPERPAFVSPAKAPPMTAADQEAVAASVVAELTKLGLADPALAAAVETVKG